MRKIVYSFILLVVMTMTCFTTSSCRDKVASSDTLMLDSVNADTMDADSMERIISDTPMPKAADELFDDFIFNFSANKRLQMQRICFPLAADNFGKKTTIAKEAWKMERFFMRQEYYTLIFDSQNEMETKVSDTRVEDVTLEKIFLDKKFVQSYHFKHEGGHWMLKAVNKSALTKNANASFLQFYSEFVADSVYQLSHINDPLEFSGPDPDDDFATMEGMLIPEQWPYFAPQLPQGMIYNIVYGEAPKASNTKIFVVRGIANGFETLITFRKHNKEWKAVRLTM